MISLNEKEYVTIQPDKKIYIKNLNGLVSTPGHGRG
jgi:hypothetical protein